MHLKPIRFHIPWRAVEIIMLPVTCLYWTVFALPFAILWLHERLKKPISPYWHPVFAWWPTRCDDRRNHGFYGTVWLETVERRDKFPHGVQFRRLSSEAPTPQSGEAVPALSATDEPSKATQP